MPEEWRDIVDFEGIYQVSNRGRVRRIGAGRGAQVGRILKPSPGGSGYLFVQLWRENKGHYRQVHTLVATAFHVRPEGAVEVNHQNGKKLQNRDTNLEWLTRGDNHKHAYATGLRKRLDQRGQKNNNAKLTTSQVRALRREIAAIPLVKLRRKRGAMPALAAKYGMSTSELHRIDQQSVWQD